MTGKTSRTSARVAKKPALLAGGNPQIAKADGDDPVQGYIAAMPGLEIPRRTNVSGQCEVRAWRERNAKSSARKPTKAAAKELPAHDAQVTGERQQP
jgi:hypothetical protein